MKAAFYRTITFGIGIGIGIVNENTKKKERSADKLVATFEAMIRDGHLKEGVALPPEREIVQDYGVSRTVAREAVLSLSSKGLVHARPGFRPVVRRPGYETAIGVVSSLVPQLLRQPGGVRNLFEIRIMMEASLARTAAQDAGRDDIRALKAALEKNGDAIDDSEAFYATDVDFHGVLYKIPGNPLLPALHRAYTDWLAPQWSNMPRLSQRNKENFEAHGLIFDAILMRDPDEAEHYLREHLASAWDQVRTTFEEL
ncbi:MAG: FCD domain-containing protein [Pseudomonadota bacterium]